MYVLTLPIWKESEADFFDNIQTKKCKISENETFPVATNFLISFTADA